MSEILKVRKLPGGKMRLVRVASSRPSRPSANDAAQRHDRQAEGAETHGSSIHIPPAAGDVEERLRRAYERGRAEGKDAAEAEFKILLSECRQQSDERIGSLLGAIGEQLRGFVETLEHDAYRFALAVAGRIIRREVTLDNATIVRQVKDAIRRVVGVDTIRLRVNPGDEDIVREHRSAFLASADSIRDLVIEVDDTVEPGGCIIESTAGNVDARISTQLRQVATALLDQATVPEEQLP